MSTNVKTDRIDFRINETDKKRLEKAASINHLSLAAYIMTTILKQADMDIKENEIIKLNEIDSNLVMNLLDSEIEPNERLKGLFK